MHLLCTYVRLYLPISLFCVHINVSEVVQFRECVILFVPVDIHLFFFFYLRMPPSANKSMKIQNQLFDDYSDELLNFASVACIIFILVGVPSNLLTIIALFRGKRTRNSTAVFIINLALSDLLFGCFNLPLAASTFLRRSWIHSDMLCRLFPLCRYGLLAVSLFTVSLITINRYIIIAHPREYPRIYQRKFLVLMVASTWIAAFSIMLPTWRGVWGEFGLDTRIGSCSILRDKNGRSPKEFLFVIAFMVPCTCIVFCYARIFYLVRRAAVRSHEPISKGCSFLEPKTPTTLPSLTAIIPPPIPLPTSKSTPAMASPAFIVDDIENVGMRPFFIVDEEDIEYIDVSDSNDEKAATEMKSSQSQPNIKHSSSNHRSQNDTLIPTPIPLNDVASTKTKPNESTNCTSTITTSLKTSFNRLNPRKIHHYVSIGGNTSNASSIYAGKMSQKDRRLLKMILVIFVSFFICYLPITLTKTSKSFTGMHVLNISGYLLVYLTTCINPLIYVVMSSEYRQAYLSLLRCEKPKDHKRKQNG